MLMGTMSKTLKCRFICVGIVGIRLRPVIINEKGAFQKETLLFFINIIEYYEQRPLRNSLFILGKTLIR